MAFDTLQVKAVEGLLQIRSASASSTWRGRGRETGESEMNNLKRH